MKVIVLLLKIEPNNSRESSALHIIHIGIDTEKKLNDAVVLIGV